MSNAKTIKLYVDPFLVWNNLAWESSQMAIASTQVICQRLGKVVLDRNPKNTSSNGRKFTLMGFEKIKASLESAQAVGVNLIMLNQQLASIAMKQMQSVHSSIVAVGKSRSAIETVNLQTRLAGETIKNSTVAVTTFAESGAKLARSAIKPVLKRVQKNASQGTKH